MRWIVLLCGSCAMLWWITRLVSRIREPHVWDEVGQEPILFRDAVYLFEDDIWTHWRNIND